jgi:hypothetical protein
MVPRNLSGRIHIAVAKISYEHNRTSMANVLRILGALPLRDYILKNPDPLLRNLIPIKFP